MDCLLWFVAGAMSGAAVLAFLRERRPPVRDVQHRLAALTHARDEAEAKLAALAHEQDWLAFTVENAWLRGLLDDRNAEDQEGGTC